MTLSAVVFFPLSFFLICAIVSTLLFLHWSVLDNAWCLFICEKILSENVLLMPSSLACIAVCFTLYLLRVHFQPDPPGLLQSLCELLVYWPFTETSLILGKNDDVWKHWMFDLLPAANEMQYIPLTHTHNAPCVSTRSCYPSRPLDISEQVSVRIML